MLLMIGVLVANKTDRQRAVTKKQGEDFAKQHNMVYFECSAVIAFNVRH
jgi:Ras family